FGAAILNTQGTYAMDRVELANSASQLNVKSGSFTTGELVVNAGTVTTAQDAILTVNGGENHATIAGLGTVAIAGDFTNTARLALAKSVTEPAGKITVAEGKTLTNTGVLAADQAELNGTLSTSISAGHFLVRETTVNTSGVLNFTEYNSKSTGDTNDQLLIAGKKAQDDQAAIPAVVNLKGGQLQVANATVKKVKLGGSDTGSFGAAILNTQGTYAMDRVELANSGSQLNVNSGSFSAGELLVNAGLVTTVQGATFTVNGGENHGLIAGQGTVVIAGDFTNTARLTLAKSATEPAGKITVAEGKTLTNEGVLAADLAQLDGTLTTSISADHFLVRETTVNTSGVLNFTEYNSKSTAESTTTDQLLIAGKKAQGEQAAVAAVVNLKGGKLQVAGADIAKIKLGGADSGNFGAAILNTEGTYAMDRVELANSGSQLNVKSGSFSAGELLLNAGQTQVSGGTLTVSTITPGSGTLVLNGGNLVSQIGQLYLDGSNNATLASTQITKKGFLTLTGGTLTLLDAGEYSTATLAALQHSFETGKIVLQTAKLHVEEDKPASMIDNMVLAQQEVVATGTAVDTTEPIKATEEVVGVKVNDNGGASLIVAPTQEDKTPVAVVLQAPTNSNGKMKTVTLAGSTDGKALVVNTDNTPLKVTVGQGVQLNLGIETSTQETKGELPALVVTDGAVVNVTKMVAKVEQVELAQGAAMNVGSDGARAVLAVEDLKVAAGATLFLDPEWTNDPSKDTVENATIVTADSATIDGNVVVGRNSLAVIGMTQDDGIATLKKFSELAWGPEGTTAAAVLGTPVTLGEAGALTIDGSLEAPTSGTGVTIAANSALVIDASQGSETTPYVTGALTNNGGTIAVANATIGKFMLADTVTNSGTLITDNPLVEATVEDNMLVESVNNAGFSQMVSSMGVQSMMRRADMVFTQTIGDRVALNQKLDKGLNLWVDVTGEKYKADGFDYKGEFSSNMGYGAFGADMALTDKVSAGVAVQYGKGKLDSDNLGIENDVQNYGLGLYGTFAVADNAQIVGELSYLTGKNDIEMTMSTFNQKLDANILSAGVTGQMQFDLGNFVLVPSVGVRVSRLHTDAMHFVGVHVESQNQTLVQLPLTLRFSGKLMESAGWSFAPTAKIAFVPTFGDKQFEALGTETTVIDTTPVQADLGVVARKGNLFFNAALQLGAGQEGSSSVGGKIGVKYVF
ncbi:MAG: autotransporter domain-containing protein, partial [Sutterella sp.]|nr:autotransporter domain-containing protein [Sutterella sp.]